MDRNCEVEVWSVDSDQHDDCCLEYLYICLFVFILFFCCFFVLLVDLCSMCGSQCEGRGILPIRLVYSPEGRGVGNLSWLLSG